MVELTNPDIHYKLSFSVFTRSQIVDRYVNISDRHSADYFSKVELEYLT